MSDQLSDIKMLRQLIDVWVSAWSPKTEPFTGHQLSTLFAVGENAIHVVDDFEGGAVVLNGIEDYLDKWVPVMTDTFSYWAIHLVAEPVIRVDGDLAVSTLQFVADGRLKNGTPIDPPPGQHGTHVWQRFEGDWKIVHEHLTNA